MAIRSVIGILTFCASVSLIVRWIASTFCSWVGFFGDFPFFSI
jgi:hypothetical protein